MSAQQLVQKSATAKKSRTPQLPLPERMQNAGLVYDLVEPKTLEVLVAISEQASQDLTSFVSSVSTAKQQIIELRKQIKINDLKAKVMKAYNKKVASTLKKAQNKAEKKARVALTKEEKKSRRQDKKQALLTKKAQEDELLNNTIAENQRLIAEMQAKAEAENSLMLAQQAEIQQLRAQLAQLQPVQAQSVLSVQQEIVSQPVVTDQVAVEQTLPIQIQQQPEIDEYARETLINDLADQQLEQLIAKTVGKAPKKKGVRAQ